MATIFKTRIGKSILYLSPDSIVANPSQPRTLFDENELQGLSESIKKNGIIQPIAIRKNKAGSYELISGERRLRAAKMANLQKVPCVLLDVDERKSAVLSLLENLQRQDLTYFEEAEAIYNLICEWGITQQEAAERLGKAQSTLANKLRLLKLSKEQRERITKVQLTERHARALLVLPDHETRDQVLNEIILKGLNVAETESYIAKLMTKTETPKGKRKQIFVRDVRLFLNTINRAIDMMKQSGLDAQSIKKETETHIEYTLKIPKKNS
ncbi:MAG: nucleoid occlusion protein [Clostridiales bacterium 43-6]|nr:MAG: nucleoid occlusion protein [Clostridiales bacterium 43-6]